MALGLSRVITAPGENNGAADVHDRRHLAGQAVSILKPIQARYAAPQPLHGRKRRRVGGQQRAMPRRPRRPHQCLVAHHDPKHAPCPATPALGRRGDDCQVARPGIARNTTMATTKRRSLTCNAVHGKACEAMKRCGRGFKGRRVAARRCSALPGKPGTVSCSTSNTVGCTPPGRASVDLASCGCRPFAPAICPWAPAPGATGSEVQREPRRGSSTTSNRPSRFPPGHAGHCRFDSWQRRCPPAG